MITKQSFASTNNSKRRRMAAGKPATKRTVPAIGLVFNTNRATERAMKYGSRPNRKPTKPGRPDNQRTDAMFAANEGLPFLHAFWARAGYEIAQLRNHYAYQIQS